MYLYRFFYDGNILKILISLTYMIIKFFIYIVGHTKKIIVLFLIKNILSQIN